MLRQGITCGLIPMMAYSLTPFLWFNAIVKRAQNEKVSLRVQIREMEERGDLDL